MRKTIAAASIGMLLIAGQAAAAAGSNNAMARIGDRVGASSDQAEEFVGLPLPVLILGGIIAVAFIAEVASDDSDSN